MRFATASALTVASVLFLSLSDVRAQTTIVSYNAGIGNPATASQVQSPVRQGWTSPERELGATDAQAGATEGGAGTWRNLDGTNENNPGYFYNLTQDDFRALYYTGWRMTVVARL